MFGLCRDFAYLVNVLDVYAARNGAQIEALGRMSLESLHKYVLRVEIPEEILDRVTVESSHQITYLLWIPKVCFAVSKVFEMQ